MLKSIELKFKPGDEFVEKTFDGRTVRGIVTKEGNKFISVQNNVKEGGISTKIIREFKNDEMIQSSCVIGSDTVCIQVFKRQNSKNWLIVLFEWLLIFNYAKKYATLIKTDFRYLRIKSIVR